MSVDTNKWLDACGILAKEHEEAKRIIQEQGGYLRQLRLDLEAAKKATATANELADQLKASNDNLQTRCNLLLKQSKDAEEKARVAEEDRAAVCKRFDPELKAAEQAAKAAHLERLKAEAAKLEQELKRE